MGRVVKIADVWSLLNNTHVGSSLHYPPNNYNEKIGEAYPRNLNFNFIQ
jgi:hypothetical protein